MPITHSDIVQEGNPVLRKHAKAVPKTQFGSAELEKILQHMETALEACDDGVAIAAPQIGVPLRIFIVSWRAFAIDEGNEDLSAVRTKYGNMIFINPEITKTSKRRVKVPEGCLSVRWLYGNVKRFDKATVRAVDRTGKSFTYGGSGLMAQIFQHETDHLNGILFIDTAEDIEEIPPEKIDELEKSRKQ